MITETPHRPAAEERLSPPLTATAAPPQHVLPQSLSTLTEPTTVSVWGLNLLPATFAVAVATVERMIEARRPGYFITANLQWAMLSDRDERLKPVNRDAAFILADGMPLVWYSKLKRRSLPERVAGSDLIYGLAERAAERGYRIFLLGGEPGVADECAQRLQQRYPGLQIAGVEIPPFRELTSDEQTAMLERIRAARPDILLAALGQPKGELWIHAHHQALGVPVCAQVGASFDFVAGRMRRAPRWLQRTGLEWAYRIWREPRRMAPRYFRNALFLAKALLRDVWRVVRGRPSE